MLLNGNQFKYKKADHYIDWGTLKSSGLAKKICYIIL